MDQAMQRELIQLFIEKKLFNQRSALLFGLPAEAEAEMPFGAATRGQQLREDLAWLVEHPDVGGLPVLRPWLENARRLVITQAAQRVVDRAIASLGGDVSTVLSAPPPTPNPGWPDGPVAGCVRALVESFPSNDELERLLLRLYGDVFTSQLRPAQLVSRNEYVHDVVRRAIGRKELALLLDALVSEVPNRAGEWRALRAALCG